MGRKAPGQGVARDVEEDTVKLFEARLRGPLGVRPALPAIPQGAQRVPGSHEGMATVKKGWAVIVNGASPLRNDPEFLQCCHRIIQCLEAFFHRAKWVLLGLQSSTVTRQKSSRRCRYLFKKD